MTKIDMSAKAVTARLKRIEQLRRLCLSLGKATFPASKEKEPEKSVGRVKGREDANSK
jgi:hypothetical protein